jgi:hypothetical protein
MDGKNTALMMSLGYPIGWKYIKKLGWMTTWNRLSLKMNPGALNV